MDGRRRARAHTHDRMDVYVDRRQGASQDQCESLQKTMRKKKTTQQLITILECVVHK